MCTKTTTYDENGFYIIMPIDAQANVSISCPVCERLMRTRDDEFSFREFTCCDACANAWARPRRVEWLRGWRPSISQVSENLLQRAPMRVVFEVD